MTVSEPERTVLLDRAHGLRGQRKRDSMLTRGLAILSAFGANDVELTLAEIARRVGLPKPTAHRLIAELLDSGFLERGERGLVLGRQMFVLGGRLQRDQKIRVLAQPHLQNLRRVTGTSLVCLSVARGRDIVHLLRMGTSRVPDGREKIVDLGARRVLAQPAGRGPGPENPALRALGPAGTVPVAGPVVRLDDAVHACAVLACPVRLPGTGVVLALSAVSAADQESRALLARELHRAARELAVRIAALPDFHTAPAGVSGAA
ncbi:helix-turn-helix domain-containing protein [Streptomyces acidiscabies]|uniref:helix-turn-helix domain-containing protein n=1 Tax=Streptomyces acidiscabies TaxID=42234 RepID=UPI00067B583A|nr:helix-turn-helix domain-containing protein [Streptomyces acidiscabies]